ncbi:MAG: DEAD/DEAH box helicase [Vicinamibacterales bacterium]
MLDLHGRRAARIVYNGLRRTPISCSPPTARCGVTRQRSPTCDFDYVILDEAQAIKNADTASAKAARLLRGRHRLALSGTPVENHARRAVESVRVPQPRACSAARRRSTLSVSQIRIPTNCALLGRALAAVHPAAHQGAGRDGTACRDEQTIVCELERPQRALYDELRDALPPRSARDAVADVAAVQDPGARGVAAPAPGRLPSGADRSRGARTTRRQARTARAASREVIEEGHKALVFSQFTSFLALLRVGSTNADVAYEYLDGRTEDCQGESSASRTTRTAGCS